MSGLLPYLGSKTHYFHENSFVFYWLLTYWVSRISFGPLTTCRSFCENSSYICIELLMVKCRMLETIQLEFVDTIIDASVVYFISDIDCMYFSNTIHHVNARKLYLHFCNFKGKPFYAPISFVHCFLQACSQVGCGGATHHPKSAKRSTFS